VESIADVESPALELPPRRPRWGPILAATAVLIIAAGVTWVSIGALDREGPPTGDDLSDTAFPTAQSGFQWISWHNVAAQIPVAWDHGWEPSTDWCADFGSHEPWPQSAPYYTLDPAHGARSDVGCPATGDGRDDAFGPAPESLWQTHLALEPADGSPDRTAVYGNWTLSTRTLGAVRLRLLMQEPESGLIDQILGSARLFTIDQNGCAPTSPVQAAEFVRPEPFDITAVESADAISVCQYDRSLDLDQPALMGSRRIEGPSAKALLTGLRQAPLGTGPDRPSNCISDRYGDTALTIRLHSNDVTHDVYVYYDWCFGNGTDDGVNHRELTTASCSPLFSPPVILWSFTSGVGSACNRNTP